MAFYGRDDDGPVEVRHPWRSFWHDRDQCWMYENVETGERNGYPPSGYGGGRRDDFEETVTETDTYRQDDFYGGRGGGRRDEYVQEDVQVDTYRQDDDYGRRGDRRDDYVQEDVQVDTYRQDDDYGRRGGRRDDYVQEDVEVRRDEYVDDDRRRFGGGAGYESERIRDDYDRDRYRVDEGYNRGSENVAAWAGEEVQRVEDVPFEVGRKFENAAYDVEHAPEEMAGWAGRKVGDVERFDDDVEGSYDAGRNEQRYEDRW